MFSLLRLAFGGGDGGKTVTCIDVPMGLSLDPGSWPRHQVSGRASRPGNLLERQSWRSEELQLSSCWWEVQELSSSCRKP